MDNTALRRTIWEGAIPCRIELDPSESRVFDGTDPFYTSLPRLSYVPLHLATILQFFEPFLIDLEVSTLENAWLEFENVPLKWHWPVGVLYDLFTGRDPADGEEEHGLPWNLILHFQNFPTKHLMRLDTPTACHDAWINCVKEADFVRHGNAKTVMSLSKAESTKLWEGLSSHDFDKFWSVNEKLVGQSSAPPRSIPVRLYVPSTPRVIQQPVHPLQESRELQTVGTALNTLLPELFPLKRVPVLARPVVHGVVVLMTTPLVELLQAAVYPDGFLHITLAMMS